MTPPGRRLRVTALLAAAAVAFGCGAGDAGTGHADGAAGSLLVFAASDLQFALPEVVDLFERTTGVAAEVVLGSTGNLTAQIEHGAPADVFLAADEAFVARLEAAGLLVPGSARPYAVGPLAVVAAPGVALPSRLGDLVDVRYETIAIANPAHAPYGMAAREAMQAGGMWDSLEARLVFGENVAQALQLIRTGNADVGIVALALVHRAGQAHLRLDERLHTPLTQTAAVPRDSPARAAALGFLDLLLADSAQAILRRHGFEPPPR